MHGWQSEPTDGSKRGCGSGSLSLLNSFRHLVSVSLYLSLCPGIRLSISTTVVVAIKFVRVAYGLTLVQL